MTGKQKIAAAFTKEGTAEIAAVTCYEIIYYRDHWKQITSYPWWYNIEPDIEKQVLWRKEVIPGIAQDWFWLPVGYSREDRENIRIEVNDEGVFKVDKRTGKWEKIHEPQISGRSPTGEIQSVRKQKLAETREEIDQLIPLDLDFNPGDVVTDGRKDLADTLLNGLCADLYPIYHVSSPLWHCYLIWGFEGMMVMIAENPDLVKYVCDRYIMQKICQVQQVAALGAEAMWIEECLVDMIGPDAYKELNVPYMTQLVESIREAGMKSIYYYTGNPARKMDHILSIGADALAFEESKKGFEIDIEDLVDAVQGRCTLLGNLDAINLLPGCTEEELRVEILRQITAGRRNKSKFIMSIGSPVTPETLPERVRLYCDRVHELGRL